MEFVAVGTAVLKMVAPSVAKALLAQVKSRLNPTELEAALIKGMQAADEQHEAGLDPSKMLFRRCSDKPKRDFLEAALKHPSALSELQKPLEAQGMPDVTCLVKVFSQVETDQCVELNHAILEPWIRTFTQTYFQKTSAYIAFRVAQDDYLEQLANWFDDVKFAGVAVEGQEVDKANQLIQIFVMPDVQEEVTRTRLEFDRASAYVLDQESTSLDRQVALLAEQRSRSSLERTGRKFSAHQLLQQTNRAKAAVLLGAPGSGKTTLLSYFAIDLAMQAKTQALPADARGAQSDPEEPVLPILLRIRDWTRFPNLSLLEYARHFAEKTMAVKPLPVGFFEYWLERGKALILLDGLDEVAEEARRYDIVQRIENFLGQHRENFAIITSRPAGYKRDFFRTNEYSHYELLMFDDTKVEEFINHWYDSRILDKAEAERKKESLRKALEDHDRIKLLARNPLLLTIISLIHRYQARLPRERYKLYDKAIETLLSSWDSNKELTEKTALKHLELDDLRRLMESLAYWIHTQGSTGDAEGGTLIDKDELLAWLGQAIRKQKQIELYEAQKEAKRFVDFIRERTGLLNEQGQDCYAFVHKTFQEYLAAKDVHYRADDDDDFEIVLTHIDEHLHDQHWQEVLLLLIAEQPKKKAARAIRRVLKRNSLYEQWLHRDLFFAGRCLAEDPKDLKVADAELVSEILDRLVALEVQRSPQVTNNIQSQTFRILRQLSESAFETDALQRLKEQSNQISELRLVKYQAELGEAEQAIKALIALLDDESSSVRRGAASALGQLGNASDKVINRLVALLDDEGFLVHNAAASALGQLGNTSDEIVNRLIALLDGKDSLVRSSAASALGQLGNASDKVVNRLIALLDDKDSLVRHDAASTLGQLGNASDKVVNQLIALLDDKDSSVSYSAVLALGQLGNASDRVVNQLIALLDDEQYSVRYSAAIVLGQLDNASDRIVNRLTALLDDEESLARTGAAIALGQLGKVTNRIVNRLTALLDDEESFARIGAAIALGRLGKTDRSLEPKLVQWIEHHQDSEHVGDGIDALWKIVEG